jgi:hypothetical protein
MLHIQIEKVWSNTTMLQFLPNDTFQWRGVLKNPLWFRNLFNYLASLFREAFFMDNNEILFNFVTNF